MPGEKLAKDTPFFAGMELPNVIYLGLMNRHGVHHRGQLSTYLRPMGAKVPGIYGPSADEPMPVNGLPQRRREKSGFLSAPLL